jgi:hypothetical protein
MLTFLSTCPERRPRADPIKKPSAQPTDKKAAKGYSKVKIRISLFFTLT